MEKSKKKAKSTVEDPNFKIVGHLVLIYVAIMAGAGTALSFTIKTMTGLGILCFILLLIALLLGLIFCIEGYVREKKSLIIASRWILYVCLGLLIIYIINIILNNYQINIQQVPPLN